MHPFVECFRRTPTLQQLRYGGGELFDLASINRFNHCLSAREVAIQSADADVRAARDFFQAHINSDFGEDRFGGVNQQLTVAGAVRARFACCWGGLVFRFDRSVSSRSTCKTEGASVY